MPSSSSSSSSHMKKLATVNYINDDHYNFGINDASEFRSLASLLTKSLSLEVALTDHNLPLWTHNSKSSISFVALLVLDLGKDGSRGFSN